jgi:hypothetical protein
MRDLRAVAAWLIRETRAAGGYISEWEIWVALACGLLLWTLAYQAPYTCWLDLGGNLQTGRRYDDAPFLGDTFNAPEPADPIPEATKLLWRWSRDDSTIVFPGIGGGRWLARVRASGGPRPSPVTSRWDDGTTIFTVAVDGVQRDYRFMAEADGAGDLRLHFVAPPLQTSGDPRTLGLVMTRVVVEPAGGVRAPALGQLALLAVALGLIYLLGRRLALGRWPMLALALALAGLAGLLLARERMALTLLAPRLTAILAGCYALGIALAAAYQHTIADCRPALPLDILGNRVVEGLQIADWSSKQTDRRSSIVDRPSLVVGLIVLAAALRLGGMLHPHARFSDDGLNANNLIGFTSGLVYFTEGLPSESGGGQAPYPPGQYIVFAPAQLLIQAKLDSAQAIVNAYRLLLRIGNALLDSLAVGLIWYVLRRCGHGPRAALLGAALYLLPPPMLKSLSVGEFANVFALALALPLPALLAIHARELSRPQLFAALLGLLGLALLGHLGVSISIFCLLGCLGLAWLSRSETRGSAGSLALAGLIVLGLVALFYYTPFRDVLGARIATPPVQATSAGIAEKLAREASRSRDLGLHPLALILGAIGVPAVALRARHWRGPGQRTALGSLLIAWWSGTLLSLGLLLFASQGVRWQPFLYPALCIGAGPALAGLWARGRAGRIVTAGIVIFLLWYGLAFWVRQISDYLH